MEDLLKAKELAEALRVNTETVRRWTRAGVIPFIKFGASKRYNLKKVTEALQAGKDQ